MTPRAEEGQITVMVVGYLAVALLETQADCSNVLAALKQAEAEPVPSDLRGRLQAARTQCGAGQ